MIKGFSVILLALLLSSCTSYIANEITSANSLNVRGNIPQWSETMTLCDAQRHCVNTVVVSDDRDAPIQLRFKFQVNGSHREWAYAGADEKKARGPLEKDLIVLFAGYQQPTQILFIHQLWLAHMTGAEVIVVPSANEADRFRFGLNYTSPVLQEIHRRDPEQVHLIGFSMGALAAQSVAAQLDNSRLYLIAPMVDFVSSTKAIWGLAYSERFFARFISEAMIEDVIQRIYATSDTTWEDTDLLAKLQHTDVPTFIFASDQDRIVDASVLHEVETNNVRVNRYGQLTHSGMVAMADAQIMRDFVSSLLGRSVSERDTNLTGIFCDGDDPACLRQIDKP